MSKSTFKRKLRERSREVTVEIVAPPACIKSIEEHAERLLRDCDLPLTTNNMSRAVSALRRSGW